MTSAHTCPVCGYDGLTEPPWGAGSEPSDEICPCCCTQFGYDDFDMDPIGRTERWTALRARWVAAGSTWWSPNRPAPDGWDPSAQLARLDDARRGP